MTAAISRSASRLRCLRATRGYGAIMIDSPLCGSRCQISSVMNGMNGCSSRSVASRTRTSVACVRARRPGLSGR